MRLAPVCFIREQPIESRGSVEAPDLLVHAVGLQQVAHSAMPSVDAFPAPTATPTFPAISEERHMRAPRTNHGFNGLRERRNSPSCASAAGSCGAKRYASSLRIDSHLRGRPERDLVTGHVVLDIDERQRTTSLRFARRSRSALRTEPDLRRRRALEHTAWHRIKGHLGLVASLHPERVLLESCSQVLVGLVGY